MTDLALARALHVLAVVLWIGGVGMVTTVLLPAIRRSYPAAERFTVFHALEERFARQARVTPAIGGAERRGHPGNDEGVRRGRRGVSPARARRSRSRPS